MAPQHEQLHGKRPSFKFSLFRRTPFISDGIRLSEAGQKRKMYDPGLKDLVI